MEEKTKYIRTNRGVFEIIDEDEESYYYFEKEEKTRNKDYIRSYIEKGKAELFDTIVELCDFIRFKTNEDDVIHYIDLHKNSIESIIVKFGGNNINLNSVRYCIETEWVLKYVAKITGLKVVLL